jgi:ankyrin repeat protein
VINLATKESGRTALHCAILSGSPQANVLYSLLLTAGADPAAVDSQGDSCLIIAVKKGGMLETVKFLAQSG